MTERCDDGTRLLMVRDWYNTCYVCETDFQRERAKQARDDWKSHLATCEQCRKAESEAK